jgi:type VI secretion system secreted protein VgrG
MIIRNRRFRYSANSDSLWRQIFAGQKLSSLALICDIEPDNGCQLMRRIFSVKTSLPAEKLLARTATITEQLGKPFQIDVELLSPDESLDFDALLGSDITLTLLMRDEAPRYFHGCIASFEQIGQVGRFALYRARVVPWLWFLSRTTDCAIFQNKSAPVIVKEVFTKHGFTDVEDKLSKSYRVRDYCVQYRETDLNFVQRLLEEEGIYYYFRHASSMHTLVLADAYSAHEPAQGYETIEYRPPSEQGQRYEDCITDWQLTRNIQPGKVVVTDYDFTKPRAPLQTQSVQSRALPKSNFEMFDYPGKYSALTEGDHYARVRLESLQAGYETVQGKGNARGLAVGSFFRLKAYPRKDQNREYLAVSATHRLDAGDYETGGRENVEPYSCSFEAIDSQRPFRPAQTAVATRVSGPQTAVVVGPPGEEIWTDTYGRVKVKFHWDRDPKRDESSSCWMRVSQTWAGKGWGSVAVPRIGQEVIVDFLEGDPDRPLITGCVYNQNNMPPFTLPAAGVMMGFKSQTHKGGGFNELSLDDTAGGQKITIHAQHDLTTTVQNNETHAVKSGNRAMTIESGTNSETVKGDSTLTIQAGARTVNVTGGDYSATSSKAVQLTGNGAGVGILGNVAGVSMTGNGQGVMVTGNGQGVTITGNDNGVLINGNGNGVSLIGKSFLYAHGSVDATIQSPVVNIGDKEVNVSGTKIVLSAGGGSITIDATGVTIVGTIVKIN